MDSLGIGKYDGLRIYEPPKPQGEAYRPTSLGAYHRCRVSTGDPLLADYEHGASDPHGCGCSMVRWFEIPFQVAIGLNDLSLFRAQEAVELIHLRPGRFLRSHPASCCWPQS